MNSWQFFIYLPAQREVIRELGKTDKVVVVIGTHLEVFWGLVHHHVEFWSSTTQAAMDNCHWSYGEWLGRLKFSTGNLTRIKIRADSRFAPSQWEMALLCNLASLESALNMFQQHANVWSQFRSTRSVSYICIPPPCLPKSHCHGHEWLLWTIDSHPFCCQ